MTVIYSYKDLETAVSMSTRKITLEITRNTAETLNKTQTRIQKEKYMKKAESKVDVES